MKASKGEREREGDVGGFWRDSEVSEVEIFEGVSGHTHRILVRTRLQVHVRARVIGGDSWYIRHKIGKKRVGCL